MRTKKHTSKSQPSTAVTENKGLKDLAHIACRLVEAASGMEGLNTLYSSSLARVLIEKKILTEDEIRQAFVNEIDRQHPEIILHARELADLKAEIESNFDKKRAKYVKRGRKS